MHPTTSQPPPDADACVAEDLPSGLSIELDAGQIFALAREKVRRQGGSYSCTVEDVLSAIGLLQKHFNLPPHEGT